MFPRVAYVLTGLLALPAAAVAAEEETRAVANAYSIMLERQLFQWHVWTTGVSRLDDGTLFGLASIVLALSFGCSGVGIILFKERGVGFRTGWLLSLPVLIASMIVYTMFKPYPAMRDIPFMFLTATLAAIIALFVARVTRGSVTTVVERPARKSDPDKPIDDRRIKMAVRPAAGPGANRAA